jgi:5-methylcytosine-specific restriction endonuclease McrA
MAEVLCINCNKAPSIGWDHVVPRRAGGTNKRTNLVPSCRRCNTVKGSRPVEVFPRGRHDVLRRVRGYQASRETARTTGSAGRVSQTE